MNNREDKSIRDNPAEDVKKLVIQKEGEGAENDYAAKTNLENKDSTLKSSARATNSQHNGNDAMQGGYKEANNPESKDSDHPYEDALVTDQEQEPLKEVTKTQNEK